MPAVPRQGVRAPAALLAAEYVHALPSVALVLVALSAWAGRSDGPVRTLGLVVVLTGFALRLVGPVYSWWSVTYVIDDTGISVTKGLIGRRSRSMTWSRVKSVETRRPWYLRLFKLNRVTLIQAGEESAQVVLRAVADDDPLLSRLRAVGASAAEVRTAADAQEADDAAPDVGHLGDETTIHVLDRRDLIFVSLAYGQAFLLAPVVLMTAWEAIDTFGLAGGLGGATERFGALPLGVAAALGAVVLGVVGTVVRFHGFRVSATRDGRLAIRYGLVETHERVVDPEAVVGVVVQRNVLERLLGRARLSVVTKEASGGLGTSLIVPSVSVAVVDALVRRHLGRFLTEQTYRSDGSGAMARGIVSALALVAVPLLVLGLMELVLETPLLWSAVAALVAFALLRVVGALATARLHFDVAPQVVIHTTRFAFERITTVAVSALHGVATVQGPGGHAGPPIFVTCHLYTGRARRLAAPRCGRQELDALRTAMAAQARSASTLMESRAT